MSLLRTLFLALLPALFLAVALPSSTAWADVNLNTASQGELEGLPGIGPAKASAILEFRDQHGGFASVEQLDDVPGIGPATMSNLRPLVSVDGEAVAASAAPTSNDTSDAPRSSAAGAINVNTADLVQLQTLPGIGPAKALAIVTDRDANGAFTSCGALQRVHGIGPATVTKISAMCTTD